MGDEQDRPARLADLRSMESRLEQRITDEVRLLESRLEQRIAEEGKTTRRHFDVVAERIESHVKLVAEVTSHHSTILDDHEQRLQKFEGPT